MIAMCVKPFLLASSVRGVLGQRLVRKICPHCAAEYTPPPQQLEALGIEGNGDIKFIRGEGCSKCRGLGYRGRTGIYELMAVDNNIREMILERKSDDIIQAAALDNGMRTMRQDGVVKISEGITTPDEVLRVS
jgi:type II secretory ATPase GspE/PulE/Tfp pilus assembly ATPase PilB-like protein